MSAINLHQAEWPFPISVPSTFTYTVKTRVDRPVISNSTNDVEYIFTEEVQEPTDAQIVKDLDLKVCHIRGHYSYTILYRPVVSNGTFYDIAVAVCAPDDQFSRKTGVSVALDHWMEGETIRIPLGGALISPDTYLREMFGGLA
jgi:hypothetical protein